MAPVAAGGLPALRKESPQTDNSNQLPAPSPVPNSNPNNPEPEPTLAPQPQAQQSQPVMLQGGIEHSERLQPVAPELQAGAIYNEQALPPIEPNNDWYWIPFWYAGLKHVDTETVLQDYDYRTGNVIRPDRVIMNRQDLAIGFQPDRNGQVWEFKRAPYRTTVEGEKVLSVMMVRNRDPLAVSQDRVVVRLVQTCLTVDKNSRQILKSEQMEQLNTYTPSAPGVMNLQSSIKSFGPDGSPTVEEQSSRVVVDRAPFQPIDFYEGRDMRSLFSRFMLSHGYGNLLPDNLQPQANQQSVH